MRGRRPDIGADNSTNPIEFGRRQLLAVAAGSVLPPAMMHGNGAGLFSVRDFGAAGDGSTVDTKAFTLAIAAAADAGGGVVRIPAGLYACHSIRLRSLVSLLLEPGATIVAAPSPGFDAAEPTGPWAAFQDFGHNHWHNSLIWAEGVHDIAILGAGVIWGRGLSRGDATLSGLPAAEAPGVANKAVALKRCRNVVLRDFAIRDGGHFGVLATGVDNLTVENLRIDTNRDGINIDACRNVHVSRCSVNSPTDDGICLKSSYALGEARATENVTISDCYVSGDYRPGTLLDGSYRPLTPAEEGGFDRPTGRIKMGTESVGGFRNIAITNCIFESCRGFALESVDGGPVEDVTIVGVTMRDIRNAPLYIRLGARLRAPTGTTVGTVRRVVISGLICDSPGNQMPAIIAGIPGHAIEDISLTDIYLVQKGGGTAEQAAAMPAEDADGYPEPATLAPYPAQGVFLRHARNVEVSHLEIASRAEDARPFVWMDDVDDARFVRLKLPRNATAPAFSLRDVSNFRVDDSEPLADAVRLDVEHETIR